MLRKLDVPAQLCLISSLPAAGDHQLQRQGAERSGLLTLQDARHRQRY
jgi:hypothetical protein